MQATADQFEDAPGDESATKTIGNGGLNSRDPTGETRYIDDEEVEGLSDILSSEEDDDGDGYDSEDDKEWRAMAKHDGVDDEDWEIAEKDFTKQYNRIKQHNLLTSGVGQKGSTASDKILPAINNRISKPRAPKSTNNTDAAADPSREASREAALDKRVTDQLTSLSKYTSRLSKIDEPYKPDATARPGVSVNRKGPSATANQKDKSDRATNEQVLDPRTRIILYKMIGRELVKEINGCVSTGKEANVYHALTPTSTHLALKIYKTSILTFKDRDRYVTGEFRFRRGYSRHNPRKMVRLWAEKEMRNLRRLSSAGVPCPEPVEVRENVLVMEFLGDEEGWASPRLKDASISDPSTLSSLYTSLLLTVRTIYKTCKLVHADLSEYNILYHQQKLYIIDVSQSVEHDHPMAFEFLRKDLRNVKAWFESRGVRCLSLVKSFEFVTGELPGGEGEEEVLEKWLEEAEIAPVVSERRNGDAEGEEHDEEHQTRLEEEAAKHAATEDSVFMQSFIPRNLNEMHDPERAVQRIQAQAKAQATSSQPPPQVLSAPSQEEEAVEETKKTKVRFTGTPRQEGESDYSTPEESEDEEGEDGGEEELAEKKSRGHRHEDRDAKKERKKAVKEEQREKRKAKMPKAEKKKRIKSSRGG